MGNQSEIKSRAAAESVLNIISSNIPIVGTAISEGLYSYWNRVKQERINSFTKKLKEYFETISNNEIDEEYLRSEDFAEFFELVLRKVSENKFDEKLNIFKDIVAAKIKTKHSNDFTETYLSLVNALIPKQIEIIQILIAYHKNYLANMIKVNDLQRQIDQIENKRRILAVSDSDENLLEEIKRLSVEKEIAIKFMEKGKLETETKYQQINKDDILVQDLIAKGMFRLKEIKDSGVLSGWETVMPTVYAEKFLEFIKHA